MLSLEWLTSKLNSRLTEYDKLLISSEIPITNRNCPNCYHDAIIQLIHMQKMKPTSGYILKSGAVFKYKGKIITNDNLTAEAAEWYISQDIDNRNQFVELARDYDEYEKVNSPT